MSDAHADLAALLPHGPEARFVREVVTSEPGRIEMLGAVPAAGPFVRDGRAPAIVALELAAQAAGLLEATDRGESPGTSANVGYIVGLRELSLQVADVPAGRDLLACVELDGVARPLTIYRVRVSLDDSTILTGKISIFTAPPPADS